MSNRNTLPDGISHDVMRARLTNLLGIDIPADELSHRNTKRHVRRRLSLQERKQQKRDAQLGHRPAGIDKADAYFYQAVVIEEVKRRAEELGLSYAYERLGVGRNTHALRIGNRDDQHIYLELYRIDSRYSRKLLTNPKFFFSVVEYSNFLIQLFGLNQYENLKLYRLDFNVDLKLSFDEVKKMLRVKYKNINRHNLNRGCDLKSLLFGGGDSKIAVYDKKTQLESKGIQIDEDVTRIEVRLTGKELPVSLLCELSCLASLNNHGRFLNPFNRVSLEPVILIDINNVDSHEQLIKLVRLQTLMDAEGFDYAYKFLNRNGNFNRDYRGLISYGDSSIDLNKVFHDNLSDFFRKKRPVFL